ncbi:MAG: ABC transporter permease [Verrucomicrobiota bacterium]
MKTVLALVLNDLKRDWKRPWSILLLAALPLAMSVLMAAIFGGKGGPASLPTVHVAILDQDKDLLSGMLRSLPAQGEAAKQLRLHFVENRAEGLRLLEKSKASALVVLPRNMTESLLNGQTNAIELYENPAEQVLPKVVREGVSLLAVGLSGAAELLRQPLNDLRELVRSNDFPADAAVIGVASESVQKLRRVRTYLFPPLVQFQTVAAADYQVAATNAPALHPRP